MEQMGYKMQYLEEMYEELTRLGTKENDGLGTFLVKNKRTGKIAVAKYIDIEVLKIYQKMEQINSRHLEKVYHCAAGYRTEPTGNREIALVITEYISGMSLHEYMEKKGLMEEAEVCGIIGQLLEVLQTIHKEGIVHRDINPDNIVVCLTKKELNEIYQTGSINLNKKTENKNVNKPITQQNKKIRKNKLKGKKSSNYYITG